MLDLPTLVAQPLEERFAQVQIDPSWAFLDKKRSDTTYITHGYHSYPAKFIPPLAARLIEMYSNEDELVLDPFGGCGTTLVEAKVNGRRSVGVDINPTAVMITTAKITPIKPLDLEQAYVALKGRFGLYDEKMEFRTHHHERIDYWFLPEQKRKLSFIYHEISRLPYESIQNFFVCAFSSILKSCSIWMQKSNKPTRDFNKKPADPFHAFDKQVRAMLRGNHSFYELLNKRGFLEVSSVMECRDARSIPAEDDSVSLVVTSPPYVTSYEYADLHQLTTLWLKYADDLADFRKRFIGTAYHDKVERHLNSRIAEEITAQLHQKDKKTAEEVANYFGEMNQVFEEMRRVMKVGGKICIVIGNTTLRGVEILNAEVFAEQLQNLGFGIADIIKREIPSKNLPSVRDEKTGRFAKTTDANIFYAYPTEYIVVMEKQ